MEESDQVSDPINIGQFITDWSQDVEYSLLVGTNNAPRHPWIAEKMGISHDMVDELENVCSIAALDDEAQTPLTKDAKFTTCSLDNTLVTVGLQKAEITRREAKIYRHKRYKRLAYRFDEGPYVQKVLREREERDAQGSNVPGPEALISVRVYKPFVDKAKLPALLYGCHVLGCTPLTALRDCIKCASDEVVTEDLSHAPDTVPRVAKDLCKGACFYIEGQFYDDDRDPHATILSNTIVHWASGDSVSVGPFTARSMQSVCLRDLTVRLGQPYLYMHQGNCEHLLVFSDLRILSSGESHDFNNYPLQTYHWRPHQNKCRACGMYLARWLVRGSEHCPEDPAFLCDTCFRAFHYDVSGHKLGRFKAYAIQRDT